MYYHQSIVNSFKYCDFAHEIQKKLNPTSYH